MNSQNNKFRISKKWIKKKLIRFFPLRAIICALIVKFTEMERNVISSWDNRITQCMIQNQKVTLKNNLNHSFSPFIVGNTSSNKRIHKTLEAIHLFLITAKLNDEVEHNELFRNDVT